MATRPAGVKYSKQNGTAALIMAGLGNLYSIMISWRGVTAGDRVYLYDGINATGKPIMQITLNDANNTISVPLPSVGLQFETGLYFKPILTGGEMDATIGYDGNG
jgi:hypothetical protein